MANIIYFTEVMQESDKKIITSMFHYGKTVNTTM